MTNKDALNFAVNALNNSECYNASEVIEKLEKMIAQLENHHKGASEEAKAKQNAKRKEATANARAALVEKVAPVLRRFMNEDKTVKEIFAEAQEYLPEGFTAAKVQNILIREMAPEIIKTERKGGKPNLYRLDATKTA